MIILLILSSENLFLGVGINRCSELLNWLSEQSNRMLTDLQKPASQL